MATTFCMQVISLLSDNLALALTSVFTGGTMVLQFASAKGVSLPACVSLIHWTERGIKNYEGTGGDHD
jgi:hypothetical protein